MSDTGPIIIVDTARNTEGSSMTFTVRLSEPATDAVTVEYAARPYQAAAEELRSRLTGTVTFAAGETVKTIVIQSWYDSEDERDEAFTLELHDPVNAGFGENIRSLSSLGWILDNDGAGSNQAIAVSNPVVAEAANGKAVFTVSLSTPSATTQQFIFRTQDGLATSGQDYVGRTGLVTFAPGQTEALVEIALIDNAAIEAAKDFGLVISGANGIAGTVGTATILEDDAAAPLISIEGGGAEEGDEVTFTLRLSEPATDAVTVSYGARPHQLSAEELRNYPYLTGTVTFAAGETVKTVTIQSWYDSEDERDEAFTLELHDPVNAGFGENIRSLSALGWAHDNDGAGNNGAVAVSNPVVNEQQNGKAVFTISLSEASDTARQFTFRTRDGDARAGEDYVARTGTVTFAAGQRQATVEIDLIGDTAAEAAERFDLIVDGAHGITGASGRTLILDDDTTVPLVSVEGGAASEGDQVAFVLRLSRPSVEAVTVDYAALPRQLSAEELRNYPYTAGTVTFAAGETVKTVLIQSWYDSEDELDEAFALELRNPVNATFGGGNATLHALGWARDDDGPTLNRTVAISDSFVTEGPAGRMAVFAVELSAAHSEAVTLGYRTIDGTALAGQDYAALSGTITFEPNQTRVLVCVPILNDMAIESPETFSLSISGPWPAPISARSLTATGTATIYDGTRRGTAASETLLGTEAAEAIDGLGGDDMIVGLGGNDLLIGGAGNDTLDGGLGADRLMGGAGNDTYVVDRGDTVVEGAGQGIDTVHAGFSHTLGAHLENLVLTGGAAINGTGNALANGLIGNGARNVLSGGAGNDALRGNGGNDTLGGGAGHDTLDGGAGVDRMAGGLGNDRYVVTAGDVVTEGAGQGIDLVESAGSWTLGANLENLILTGRANANGTGNALANALTGNGGNNVLRGAGGHDTLMAGSGNDLLDGGAGNDMLRGGDGADRLIGGAGRDTMWGGLDRQRDVFVFQNLAESAVGAGRDQVHNFVSGRDDIDLSALDAHAGRGGNQAFAFAGTTAAAHAVWYVAGRGGVTVRIDDDGDRQADMEIWVSGLARLGAGDFLL